MNTFAMIVVALSVVMYAAGTVALFAHMLGNRSAMVTHLVWMCFNPLLVMMRPAHLTITVVFTIATYALLARFTTPAVVLAFAGSFVYSMSGMLLLQSYMKRHFKKQLEVYSFMLAK